MQNLFALFLPLFSGFFFLLGFLIEKALSKKEGLSTIATSMAFIVMLGIVFLDLVPEIIEISNKLEFSKFKIILFITIPILIGLISLKLLDSFIPQHNHNHNEHEKNHKEHNAHAKHIGIITASSLIFHNLLEGISIFILGVESFLGGLSVSLAVGLHNLPLGVEIASSFEHNNQKTKRIFMLLLTISGFLGSILLYFFGQSLNNMVLLILMSLSLGMILYIVLFELLSEVIHYNYKKETIYGILIGIILLLCISRF